MDQKVPVTPSPSDVHPRDAVDDVSEYWKLVQNNHEHINNIGVSVVYLIATVFITHKIKQLLQPYISEKWHDDVMDFVATFHECAYTFENCILFEFYGDLPYGFSLLTLGWLHLWLSSVGSCNPISTVSDWMQGKLSTATAIRRFAIQMVAGQLSFYWALSTWKFQFSHVHLQRWTRTACPSDMTVSVLVGFLIEASTAFASIFIGLMPMTKLGQGVEDHFKVAIDVLLVLVSVHFTGGYFNPANASAQTFGCFGNTNTEHIFVYWIGPVLGAAVAAYLHHNWWRPKEKAD